MSVAFEVVGELKAPIDPSEDVLMDALALAEARMADGHAAGIPAEQFRCTAVTEEQAALIGASDVLSELKDQTAFDKLAPYLFNTLDEPAPIALPETLRHYAHAVVE